ncbi:MAG: Sapep family Mn(2+)-dependent dipeptidase [Coriobacteriales bacterium]|jgi:succinyl-diaminopimelate desuccinylase
MDEKELDRSIDSYLDQHWEDIVSDIDTLVQVESVEGSSLGLEKSPFGKGPREALDKGLEIADRLGMQTDDMDGYIGVADIPGESPRQLAIIGHTDVVEAGSGWTFEPYKVTRKDGYLIGRGTADDKGPLVVAMHAASFWASLNDKRPYTLRILLGANEETHMGDVEHYLANTEPPAFLITPDAEFPVCYGEKGIANFVVRSKKIENHRLVSINGGSAVNAVPGFAEATLYAAIDTLNPAPGIGICKEGCASCGLVGVEAAGTSAHASTPELGDSAITRLIGYLLTENLCSDEEREFLELVFLGAYNTDGSGYGLACSDENFGPLTMNVGKIWEETGSLCAAIDVRYPTTTDPDILLRVLKGGFAHIGATVEMTMNRDPFLLDPNSPEVKTLIDVYNSVTGEDAKPFTTGGGTYARMFPKAVSFGPARKDEVTPEWLGSMHGPDEGMSEDLLKQEFKIYVKAIDALMGLDL